MKSKPKAALLQLRAGPPARTQACQVVGGSVLSPWVQDDCLNWTGGSVALAGLSMKCVSVQGWKSESRNCYPHAIAIPLNRHVLDFVTLSGEVLFLWLSHAKLTHDSLCWRSHYRVEGNRNEKVIEIKLMQVQSCQFWQRVPGDPNFK